jgi:proteasome accessory factor B
MAAAKTERLMNLLIMLLVQRGYVTRSRIRELLYADSSEEAFERMFERDKEELRSLGVPIETGSYDELFEDELGYRISPASYALPEISLTADEAAVIGLATRVWENASLAEATTDAVRKLRAAGLDVDETALEIAQPRLSADEPSFEGFLEATQARREVSFGYRRPDADGADVRHLQPWGVFRSSGRWYVVGHDVDRGAERVFRLSRVVGEVRATSADGAYDLPEELDVGAIGRSLTPAPTPGRAVLLARPGTGHQLRSSAAEVETGVVGPGEGRWDRLVITSLPGDLVGEVLSHGADVVVLEPAELRAEVVARLRELVA